MIEFWSNSEERQAKLAQDVGAAKSKSCIKGRVVRVFIPGSKVPKGEISSERLIKSVETVKTLLPKDGNHG